MKVLVPTENMSDNSGSKNEEPLTEEQKSEKIKELIEKDKGILRLLRLLMFFFHLTVT